jgi:intracellular septation protein A
MNLTSDLERPVATGARRKRGRISGLVLAAAPTIAFVVTNAVSSLTPALITAGAVAVVAFAWRLWRRQPLRQALVGLLIVAVCAGVAAVTGQARGFFLVPTLIPFVVIAVCLGSVLLKRPLTGLILNRAAGGPADWPQQKGLRRVYTVSTLVCVAVNVVNASLQATFYLADDPVVLAVAHIATGPIFATIVAVTVVAARRQLPQRKQSFAKAVGLEM